MADQAKITELLDKAWEKRIKGEFKAATTMVKEAQRKCPETDYNTRGRIYHIYMQISHDQHNLQTALEFSLHSHEYYVLANNQNKIAHSGRHMADLLVELKRYEEAEQQYITAIHIYKTESGTHSGDLANALRAYAILLEKMQRRDEAIEMWYETRLIYQAANFKAGVNEANK
ncbi:MAG: tetratricopeptide repeat protein, partial [Calditrichaeota bacterium]|nr:tetratricopeptide repeat protein [Calditrichota bacterium]